MLNTASWDPLHITNYVGEYLDLVESLPFDLQRNVSLMREMDSKYQGNVSLFSPNKIHLFVFILRVCCCNCGNNAGRNNSILKSVIRFHSLAIIKITIYIWCRLHVRAINRNNFGKMETGLYFFFFFLLCCRPFWVSPWSHVCFVRSWGICLIQLQLVSSYLYLQKNESLQ